MDGWMMDRWMDEWMDGMDGWVGGWMMDGWMDGWMGTQVITIPRWDECTKQ